MACISEELLTLEGMISGRLAAISSCADGADKAFLNTCRNMGVPYQVYLPFQENEFRRDFSEEGWKEVEELLFLAASVQRANASTDRPTAYLECGMEVVDDSDLLLVVWDGNTAAGKGGTGDVVEYARSLRKPLIWIHSESMVVVRENFSVDLFRDSQKEALRVLFEKYRFRESIPHDSSREIVKQLQSDSDAYASQAAPQLRGMASGFVALSLFLVISGTISGLLSSSSIPVGKIAGGILDVMNLLIFLFIFATTASRFLKKRQTNWLLCRFIAEFSRSALATWEIPCPIDPIPKEAAPDFQHLIRSIVFCKMVGRAESRGSLDAITSQYVENRIRSQKNYYLEKSRGLAPQERRNRILFWIATIAGGIFGLLVLLVSVLQHACGFHGNTLIPVLRAGVSIFPSIATAVLSITFIREIGRRLAHNRRMIELLDKFESQALHCTTMESLARIAERTERTLMGEVLDWYYYNRYGS